MNEAFGAAIRPKVERIAPHLFIFDLNGVLFDTEYGFATLVTKLAQENQLKANEDVVFRRLSSKGVAERFEMIAQMNDVALKPAELKSLCAAYRQGRDSLLDSPDLPLIPGAVDLLKALKKEGHILAAITGDNASLTERALKHTRLLDFFEERVYTAESMNDKTQLDPAMLATILADTRFSAGNALLVDDGLAGLAAAKGAGIVSFGYVDPRFARHIDRRRQEMAQAGATLTVEMLIDIHTLLLTRTLPSRMRKPSTSFDFS